MTKRLRTHFIPLDLIKLLHQLLPILSLSKEFVEMRSPFIGGDDVAGELVDVCLDVGSEDIEAADLSFDVEEEVTSP